MPTGAACLERGARHRFAQGVPVTPAQSAEALIAHLSGDETGAIWNFTPAPAASAG